MTGAEKGFLLLTSHLGDYSRDILTVAQFRELAHRVSLVNRDMADRHLTGDDLVAMGYPHVLAQRIVSLLSDETRLRLYLQNGEEAGCFPLTRASSNYPLLLRKRLGLDSPGCLWLKGNAELLERPAVALVGSRELRDENRAFAEYAGKQIAKQGYVLVSGNARGADRTAQEACLAEGGSVICVVADNLSKQPAKPDVLYISEQAHDAAFTAQRAHSRNRVIHALGMGVLVAQSSFGKGGTWHGTRDNLKNHFSQVYVYDDGSEAASRLVNYGAQYVSETDVNDFNKLFNQYYSLL